MGAVPLRQAAERTEKAGLGDTSPVPGAEGVGLT